MKQERSKVKSDILLRVRLLYVLFILAGGIVLARLVWVQLFSAEVAYNADRLAGRIFTEEVNRWPRRFSAIRPRSTSPRRGSIRSRHSGSRPTRWPNCWPPFSGTNPPRLTRRGSATNTPAATGW